MTDVNQEYSLGGFGTRLKVTREAMNLSQKDAALRLHLSPNILQILESDNVQKTLPPTFIRGYLRSYARLLNINEEDINAALTQSGLEPQARTPVIPTLRGETMQVSDRYVQWVSTTVVLGLFVFVGAWWGLHSSSHTTNTTLVKTALPTTSTNQPQPVAAPAPAPTQPTTASTTTPQAPAATANMTTQPAPALPAAAPATVATAPTPPQSVTTPAQPPVAAAAPTAPPATPAPVMSNAATPATPPTATPLTPGPTVTGASPAAPMTTVPQDGLTIPGPVQPNTTVTASDTPKKHNRHHKQDSTVSGFAMALPEPGL